MLTEKNGRDYSTPQVRSKFIEEHETCFILEMETGDKIKKKIPRKITKLAILNFNENILPKAFMYNFDTKLQKYYPKGKLSISGMVPTE